MRPQLWEFNHSSAIWLHSILFLLVFFDSQARISLLGDVDRACTVDNHRRRGAAIAGFRIVLFGSRIELCRASTKSLLIWTIRKIGTPVHIKWYQSFRRTVRFNTYPLLVCAIILKLQKIALQKNCRSCFRCPITFLCPTIFLFSFASLNFSPLWCLYVYRV